MSRLSRKPVQQPDPRYAAVPTTSPQRVSGYTQHPASSSQTHVGGPRAVRSPSKRLSRRTSGGHSSQQHGSQYPASQYASSQQHSSQYHSSQQNHQQARNATAMGVATGNIGGGYGPYSYNPQQAKDSGMYQNGRFSNSNSAESVPKEKVAPPPKKYTSTAVPQYMWDKDPDVDDFLHNPDPRGDWVFRPFSWRGWMNIGGIILIILGLLMLFIGTPVFLSITTQSPKIRGWNVGGINGTGQIPVFTNFPRLIDNDTPSDVMTRTGTDGKTYDLVFSDEFNLDGRTFYPGDDPFWEAADLHYWPTGNAEWYDPAAVTTKDGKLAITMTEQLTHDLNFQSGMITSWNKMCFTTGYVEVSMSLAGPAKVPGLWPGAWTLGNLGRPAYGATTEGTWPYSYDTCDLGTFPNQTTQDGIPQGIQGLSNLPGQKLSACTCPGSDHPGPRVDVGRGVPEIDILEATVDVSNFRGQASQSFQIAPYDFNHEVDHSKETIYDTNITLPNTYTGGPLQQALSTLTYIDDKYYDGKAYTTWAYEYWSDPTRRSDGYITWFYEGKPSWTTTAAAIAANPKTQVGQRLIPEEPMYVILNLGMGSSFQKADYKNLKFPTTMYVDYVRIYQRRGVKNGVTCDPPNYPTAAYIARHPQAYGNANLTTWAMANETFPRNSKYDGC
ncbi:glycoside hydrolase family 16 protein [Crepidotus variabilis]|uniref:Glycoside hydrolase family 16 protein n=1 Tax=Crepidotus variabilis TaxID=179855 RepID=A0A9P6EQY0_9AGAR|nr:glycoside hydrolase family 16 protein [Crepidotus variabilis]